MGIWIMEDVMSEKCDFCIGGKCVDSADEVPCGWAEGERWSECGCATFGTFDEDEAVEVGKMNREEGLSVPLEQTGPAGGQTVEDAGARMCDFYRNGMCEDDGVPCWFQTNGEWAECPCYKSTGADAAPSVSEADSLCGDPVAALTVPGLSFTPATALRLPPSLAGQGSLKCIF